jgi:hypothetical protein
MVALEPRVDWLEYPMADLTENVTRLSIEIREMKEEFRIERAELPRIPSEIVGCAESEIQFIIVRSNRRRSDGETHEFDVLAGCTDVLLINETKSRRRPNDAENFVDLLGEARSFLLEYADRRIAGVLATFYVDPSLIRFGERQGLVMLSASDGVMEQLNRSDFTPRFF